MGNEIETHTKEGLIVTEKAPRVLLEIFVMGVEEDKPKIKKMNDELQAQMAKHRNGKRARILWYVDKGEKTEQEKIQWFMENCRSKYNIFAPTKTYSVKPDFVQSALIAIKKMEDSIDTAKKMGIARTGVKPQSEQPVDEKTEQKPDEKSPLKIVE